MKKTIAKKVAIIAAVIVGIILLYTYLAIIFMPKDLKDLGGEKYYGAIAYKYEKKNSIDVMMYGNSDLYSGIIPMQMYENSGITSYGCGASKQTVSAVYSQIKKTFKTQKPKVVAIEADCLFYPNAKNGGTNAYEGIKFIAPFKYHARWKELEWKDFGTLPTLKGKDNFLKGFVFSNKVQPYKLKEGYMTHPEEKPAKFQKSVLKDFDKIVKLCQNKGAQVLIMAIPSPITWSNAKHNAVEDLLNSYAQKNANIPFLDMNLALEGFDYSVHFRDNGNHCNFQGAKVVTKRFESFLKENCQLDDRRGDKDWDRCLEKYKDFIGKKNDTTL